MKFLFSSSEPGNQVNQQQGMNCCNSSVYSNKPLVSELFFILLALEIISIFNQERA